MCDEEICSVCCNPVSECDCDLTEVIEYFDEARALLHKIWKLHEDGEIQLHNPMEHEIEVLLGDWRPKT